MSNKIINAINTLAEISSKSLEISNSIYAMNQKILKVSVDLANMLTEFEKTKFKEEPTKESESEKYNNFDYIFNKGEFKEIFDSIFKNNDFFKSSKK